jgi:hypothetical protein
MNISLLLVLANLKVPDSKLNHILPDSGTIGVEFSKSEIDNSVF